MRPRRPPPVRPAGGACCSRSRPARRRAARPAAPHRTGTAARRIAGRSCCPRAASSSARPMQLHAGDGAQVLDIGLGVQVGEAQDADLHALHLRQGRERDGLAAARRLGGGQRDLQGGQAVGGGHAHRAVVGQRRVKLLDLGGVGAFVHRAGRHAHVGRCASPPVLSSRSIGAVAAESNSISPPSPAISRPVRNVGGRVGPGARPHGTARRPGAAGSPGHNPPGRPAARLPMLRANTLSTSPATQRA